MLHRRTSDPAQRAASIADKEAEKVWRETGDYKKQLAIWKETYDSALSELCYQG